MDLTVTQSTRQNASEPVALADDEDDKHARALEIITSIKATGIDDLPQLKIVH